MFKKVFKKHILLFCSLPNIETTFPHGFVFLFIPYLVGVIFSKKCQKRRVGKTYKGRETAFSLLLANVTAIAIPEETRKHS